MGVRHAVPNDLAFLVDLQNRNRESVGHLPSPAIEERINRGTALLSEENGDPCGYMLYDLRSRVVRVPQACIQYDARRRKHGEALVAKLIQLTADAADECRLRCAADLEANVFWRDMGFTCTTSLRGGSRRGRLINAWVRWFSPRLITLSELQVLPAAQFREDCMYDDTGYMSGVPAGFVNRGGLGKLAWSNRR
jgi:hypothetical protein